jgi:hypothetical protein
MLFDMLQVAIDEADCPSMNDVLEPLIKVINYTFDFHKEVIINIKLMQLNVAQMATYGIISSILQLTLILLTNIKTATKSNYGHKFRAAMHAICKNTLIVMCMMRHHFKLF